jgi:hypothetical protein
VIKQQMGDLEMSNIGASTIDTPSRTAYTAAMRLIRVFPRKTKATPDDALAYFGPPDRNAEADAVHVSVTFTYDKQWAEHLAEQWKPVAPVTVGGVAYGDRGDDFVPGRYIKPGYVFTSRGCPRRCWFCSVWKRDPVPRLLPVIDGWNVLDDNLLACPRDHVEAAALRQRDPALSREQAFAAVYCDPQHAHLQKRERRAAMKRLYGG